MAGIAGTLEPRNGHTRTAGPLVPEARTRRIRLRHTDDVHGTPGPQPGQQILATPGGRRIDKRTGIGTHQTPSQP